MKTENLYGYRRTNGKVGSRNYVAVIPSVGCANDVASAIVSQTDNTRGLYHNQGCCQLPPDLKMVTDSLIGLGVHPNVGAVLIVSLGCEGTDVERLMSEIEKSGKKVELIKIQELGGMSNSIAEGVKKAQKLSIEISTYNKELIDISDIVMSIKCGASDATSGLASNCTIGYVADKLVELGGTVVFGETTEFIGAEHVLAQRAINENVKKDIYRIVDEMEKRSKTMGCDMRKGQPTPGNIEGGLSSIEDKSLGAIMKSGTKEIQGVLNYTDIIENEKGLWIKDTPGRESEILTGMAITGAQCMLFSTGRGAPQGFPIMPVLKICGNPKTYNHMINDMDINAGEIILGEKSIEEKGEETFNELLKVISGKFTKNEAIKYYNSFDIYTLGPII